MIELTREQEEYVEGLAVEYPTVKVEAGKGTTVLVTPGECDEKDAFFPIAETRVVDGNGIATVAS